MLDIFRRALGVESSPVVQNKIANYSKKFHLVIRVRKLSYVLSQVGAYRCPVQQNKHMSQNQN